MHAPGENPVHIPKHKFFQRRPEEEVYERWAAVQIGEYTILGLVGRSTSGVDRTLISLWVNPDLKAGVREAVKGYVAPLDGLVLEDRWDYQHRLLVRIVAPSREAASNNLRRHCLDLRIMVDRCLEANGLEEYRESIVKRRSKRKAKRKRYWARQHGRQASAAQG